MENKICTTINQSKRLIELGIDVNTADFHWFNKSLMLSFDKEVKDDYDETNHEYIPAWSLSALLELFDDKAGIAKEYGTWFAYDNGKSHCGKHFDNPLDAAFEMAVWLKENKKI